MCSRDYEDEMWSRFVFELVIWPNRLLWKDELNPRVRCAFGNVFFTRPPGLWSFIKPLNIGCDIKRQNHMKRLDGELKPCVIYVFGLACVCSMYYIRRKGRWEQKRLGPTKHSILGMFWSTLNLSRMNFCISSVSSIWTDIFVFHRRNTKDVKTTFSPPHWIAYQD